MEESIPLSALQHYAFCKRQCALIWNDNEWSENVLTTQGKLLHERVDSGIQDSRKSKICRRNIHVCSELYGIHGIIDMVEEDKKTGELNPVEYKRGKVKFNYIDEIQLCAQGLCLEEMTGRDILYGAIWYDSVKQRKYIDLSIELREITKRTIWEVRELLQSKVLPVPEYNKRCKSCSLINVCQPKLVLQDLSSKYVIGTK